MIIYVNLFFNFFLLQENFARSLSVLSYVPTTVEVSFTNVESQASRIPRNRNVGLTQDQCTHYPTIIMCNRALKSYLLVL